LLDLSDFHRDPPARLFCYVTLTSHGWECGNFTGTPYGRVHVGASYTCPAFGRKSTRRSVTLSAVNGWIYSGTFFESSGDYARLKRTQRRVSPSGMESMRRANFGPGAI
jgi:hypothetical protein